MDPTHPRARFGGTWVQITDKFLYCANSSKQEGGSKKITVANLPAHTHADVCTANPGYNPGSGIHRITHREDTTADCDSYLTGARTGSTGEGSDYMPPYITVYAWYRTA